MSKLVNCNYLVFIVSNPARVYALNNFIFQKKWGTYKLLFFINKNAKLFEPIIFYIAKFFSNIKVVYSDNEFDNRNDVYRVRWNNPSEVSGAVSDKDIFVCKFVSKEYKHLQLFPTRIDRSLSCNNQVVFVGEVTLNVNSIIKFFYEKNSNELNQNLIQLLSSNFWDNVKKLQFNELTVDDFYCGLVNLIRYDGIKNIIKSHPNMILVGDDWVNYGFSAQNSFWSSTNRKSIYNGNICVDFGSKSGINALYQRPIEIIESGGILIQIIRSDSIEIYGEELASLICFESFRDLNHKLTLIVNSKTIFLKIRKMLIKRFVSHGQHSDQSFNYLFN